MKIVDFEKFGEKELIERLRNLTMLKDRDVKPYVDAFISLENICIDDIFPAQRYVLKNELLKVRELKWHLEGLGINIFKLDGFVRLYLEGTPEPIDLLPPVVEEFIEQNGRIVHIVNDGMHRVYTAFLEWVIPQVLFIRGIPKNLPYYSYPIPEKDWKQIELREDIPPGFIKKWHRIANNKLLYRDFNSVFKNVGGPRGFSA